LPIVVKPVDEGGSIGIFAVRDDADLVTVVDRFQAVGAQIDKRDLAGNLDRFLMEEYLDGPEISVETLSFDGRHVVVGITDKTSTDSAFVETGHATPSQHPNEVLRAAEDLVIAFLDAVGLRHGPGHTEVKLTSRGPRIVEGHNRVGGDRINELTEIAYGVDMDRYALAARFDLLEPLADSPKPVAGAAIRFFIPSPGRVVAVTGADDVADDPALVELDISVRPGDVVRPLTWSDDRVGFVIARGETTEEAIAHAERLRSTVHIHTEPL
jgi:biotin carboxylase